MGWGGTNPVRVEGGVRGVFPAHATCNVGPVARDLAFPRVSERHVLAQLPVGGRLEQRVGEGHGHGVVSEEAVGEVKSRVCNGEDRVLASKSAGK